MKTFLFTSILVMAGICSQAQNVGIGVSNPVARLDVVGRGATGTTNNFMIRNADNDTILTIKDDGKMGINYRGPNFGRTMNMQGTGVNFYSTEAKHGGSIFPTDTSLVIWSSELANRYVVIQPSWGNTGIGTYTPNAKFHVNGAMLMGSNSSRTATGYALSVTGKIICADIVTQAPSAWPDYVFSPDYNLLPLDKLEKTIKQDRHLPNIPSAEEIADNGLSLSEMSKKSMEKIEELTLYVIELYKQNVALNERLQKLEQSKKTPQ